MSIKWFNRYHLIPELHLYLNPKHYLKEETAIYLTHTLKFMALALVGVYVPVYIFVQAKSLSIFSPDMVTNGIMWLLLYYIIKVATILTAVLFLAPLIFSKINFQRSLLLSSLALVAHISCLIYGEGKPTLLLLSAFFSALEIPLYWIPYHLLFIRKLKSPAGHYGSKTGLRFFLVRVVSGASPLIGGLIISNMGFSTLFILAIILLIFSNVPILTLVHEWKHHKHSISNVVRNFCLNPKFKYLTLAFLGQGIETGILIVVWPVMLYLVLDSFVKIGILNSASLLISAVALLIIGKMLDKGKSKIVHGFGVSLGAILNLLKIFIGSQWGLYMIDISEKLKSPMYALPNISLFYEKAKRIGPSDLIIYREVVLHSFILLTLIVLFLIVPILPNWRLLFIPAAIGSLLAYSINFDKN
jgi:hypothetical protein